ncbi:hypothetical protein [Cohnella caldifontis]|nr:hypothetical protein [Cohnella sp. YIM B05605]
MKAYTAPQVIVHQAVVFERHSKPSGRKPPKPPKPPKWPPGRH